MSAYIDHTAAWIQKTVIGCNFCPFAAKAILKKTVRYVVEEKADNKEILATLLLEVQLLDEDDTIETTFIILPTQLNDFEEYLDVVEKAERLLIKNGYEGVYQLASFHPHYLFAGSKENDAANYTNRSPYPMLHLLREDSITAALENFEHPENIPDKNIAFARAKGLAYMQALLGDALK